MVAMIQKIKQRILLVRLFIECNWSMLEFIYTFLYAFPFSINVFVGVVDFLVDFIRLKRVALFTSFCFITIVISPAIMV